MSDIEIKKLEREIKRKNAEIEKLIYQVADYYFMNKLTRPQIDKNGMDLLDELAACGYESEVQEALGGHNDCA